MKFRGKLFADLLTISRVILSVGLAHLRHSLCDPGRCRLSGSAALLLDTDWLPAGAAGVALAAHAARTFARTA